MKRLATSLSLAAALLATTLAGSAMAQDYNSQRNGSGRNPGDYGSGRDPGSQQDGWSRGRDRAVRADLQGHWVADGRGADARYDQNSGGGRGMRGRMMLPLVISIDQRPDRVRISDDRNHMLQQILIDGRFDPRGEGRSNRSDYLSGSWRGSTLTVEATGPRGGAITQTFALQNRGRTLVVRTRREGSNSGRTVELTTVYRRA